MDAVPEDISYEDASATLSYDDGITYEEQVAALPAEMPRVDTTGLANRISANKVYLPPESMSKGKRKRADEALESMDEDEDDSAAPDGLRPNALYLYGSPIAHLPTNNIFAYARHFNLDPVGLEWIDDSSCVLVFPTNAACRAAFEAFRRLPGEEPDIDDCVSAKPIPEMLWPAEDRINKTLGIAEGMKGTLLMRIARKDDKKSRGAKLRSTFYQKHGMDAGKDPNAHSIGRAPENGGPPERRRMRLEDDAEKRRQLDDELDEFLHDEGDHTPSPPPPPSPPSKMRSDYMTEGQRENKALPKRSLLERTSVMRIHVEEEDGTAQLPSQKRRQRGGKGRRRRNLDEEASMPPSRRQKNENGETRVPRPERPMKTLEELDDELDAFLNGND